MAISRKPRSTRTKLETKQAAQDIMLDVQPTFSPREKEQLEARNAAVLAAVQGVTVDSAVKKITETSIAVNKTLSSVTEQVVSTAQQLVDIQNALSVEKAELENLYGKDILSASVRDLVEEYDAKATQLEADFESKNNEYAEARETSQKQYEETQQERNKARQREQEEYTYTTNTKRRIETDQFNSDLAAKRLAFETDFGKRAAELKAKETEFNELKTQVTAFPETLKTSIAREVAIVSNSMKKDHTNEMNFLRKDFEGQIALHTQNFKVASDTMARQQATITLQEQRIAELTGKVENIAGKALEAASGRQALSELRDMQQRNEVTTTTGKR